VHKLGLSKYDPGKWRRFIDAFLYNENIFGSVPVAHSVLLKERYENLEIFYPGSTTIGKPVAILNCIYLTGGTKYPYFKLEWDSRA
jgi:hypothetical protein